MSLDSSDISKVTTPSIEDDLLENTEFSNFDFSPETEFETGKCGEIFVYSNGKFSFCCYFCDEKFNFFPDFIHHIQEIHLATFCVDSDETSEEEWKIDNTEILLNEVNRKELQNESRIFNEDQYGGGPIGLPQDYFSSQTKNEEINQEGNFSDKEVETEDNSKQPEKTFLNRKCSLVKEQRNRLTPPYKCPECPKTCNTRGNLNVHIRRQHRKEKPHQCVHCEKRFVSTTEKKRHEMTHTGEKPYQCEVCGKKFRRSGDLLRHRRQNHLKWKQFACKVCGMQFGSTNGIKTHMICHSNGEKQFECEVCEAKFPRKGTLTEHLRIHAEIKEFSCLTCGKSFAQKQGLYSHMKSHKSSLKTKEIVENFIN